MKKVGDMEFVVPSVNYYGDDCFNELEEIIKSHNINSIFVVTSKDLIDLNLLDELLDILYKSGVKVNIFDEVVSNPTEKNVLDGLSKYEELSCDSIMSVGGGSVNDCAKAIGIMASNGGEIHDYIGYNKSKNNTPLLICINTTAGTASEISRAFLISNKESVEKMIFKDIHALPDYSFNNPKMMLELPPKITAQTGMDALTHAIESYVSKGSYGLTDEFALSSIKLIFRSLGKVVKDGHNKKLRNDMIYAQSLAGMAFCNSGLGLVHAMAHQLGALYNLPHGLCNAILLPYVMEFNSEVSSEKYANIYRELFAHGEKISDKDACETLIDKVKKLSESVGTNVSLKEIGVKEKDFRRLSEMTLLDGNLFKNPRSVTLCDVETLFKREF